MSNRKPFQCCRDDASLVGKKGQDWLPTSSALLVTAISLSVASLVMHIPLLISTSKDFDAFDAVAWAEVDLGVTGEGYESKLYFALTRFGVESQNRNYDDNSFEYGAESSDCVQFQDNADNGFDETMCNSCEDAGVETLALSCIGFVMMFPALICGGFRFNRIERITWESQAFPSGFAFVAGLMDLVALLNWQETCFDTMPTVGANYGPAFYVCIVCVCLEWLVWLIHMLVFPTPIAVDPPPKPAPKVEQPKPAPTPAAEGEVVLSTRAVEPVRPNAVYSDSDLGGSRSINIYPQQLYITGGQASLAPPPMQQVYSTYSAPQPMVQYTAAPPMAPQYVPNTTIHYATDPHFEDQGVYRVANNSFQAADV